MDKITGDFLKLLTDHDTQTVVTLTETDYRYLGQINLVEIKNDASEIDEVQILPN